MEGRPQRQQLKEVSAEDRNTFMRLYNQNRIQKSNTATRAHIEIRQRPRNARFSVKTVNTVNSIIKNYKDFTKPQVKHKTGIKRKRNNAVYGVCPRRSKNALQIEQGVFEYIQGEQRLQIPIEYLMFLDTLHDIFEGDRASNIKSLVKNKFKRWGDKYLQLGSNVILGPPKGSGGTYLGYMRNVVDPFTSKNKVIQTLTNSVPAMLNKKSDGKKPVVYKEPTITELKKHMLDTIRIVMESKYGNVYSMQSGLTQPQFQYYVRNNDMMLSVDAVKYSLFTKGGILSKYEAINIRDKVIVTAAQIFDSANTSITDKDLVLIKPCKDGVVNNPYNIRGTFDINYQGSITQIGNRFDMYVLTPTSVKGYAQRSNALYPVGVCVFVAVRVPLQARTKMLNNKVKATNFINQVVISTQLPDMTYDKNKMAYVNGNAYLRRWRGLSIHELQGLMKGERYTDKDTNKILMNIVFDWKRQQDSFQMVFSKMLNDTGMKHFVTTHDFLAFAFGIYYGTNVILQDRGLYYIYENVGKVDLRNINTTRRALSILMSSVKARIDEEDRMNYLTDAAMFQMISNGLKATPLERRALLQSNVKNIKFNLINTINARRNLTKNQKKNYINILQSKNNATIASYLRPFVSPDTRRSFSTL